MNASGGPSEARRAKGGASADSAEEMKDTRGVSPWRLHARARQRLRAPFRDMFSIKRRSFGRQFLIFTVGLCVVLASVIVINTIRFTSKQMQVEPASPISLDAAHVSQRLAKALQFRTISGDGAAPSASLEFLRLHRYLEGAFPSAHSVLTREIVADYSLLYTWKGEESAGRSILLAGHLDVVPAHAEDGWTHPPFAGRIADGYIWGRGAMDDKMSVVGILEAVERLLADNFKPRRTLYLAFGHDEESGGVRGAARIAQLLKARGIQPEFILDEGGMITKGILTGMTSPVALIGVAEKGYMTLELTVESAGGHASIPPRQTAIGILSAAIHRIEENPFPRRTTEGIRRLFDYVGPEMSLINKALLANLWLFGSLAEYKLASSPNTNGLIRTTAAATRFEGGAAENVLPTRTKAVVNIRILTGETSDTVLDRIRKTISDPRVKIHPVTPPIEPSPVSDTESPSFKTLQTTIHQVYPTVIVAPFLLVAATDSRHYEKLSPNIYRFMPLSVDARDISRFHGIDERISIADYQQGIRFFIQLIRNAAS